MKINQILSCIVRENIIDENRSNLVMYSNAKDYDVMVKTDQIWWCMARHKFHDENESIFLIYSEAKCHDENRPNIV